MTAACLVTVRILVTFVRPFDFGSDPMSAAAAAAAANVRKNTAMDGGDVVHPARWRMQGFWEAFAAAGLRRRAPCGQPLDRHPLVMGRRAAFRDPSGTARTMN